MNINMKREARIPIYGPRRGFMGGFKDCLYRGTAGAGPPLLEANGNMGLSVAMKNDPFFIASRH